MELDDSIEAFRPIGEFLEELGISYQLGGSVASSIHGVPRGTNDVDVEVDLRAEHVDSFVAGLQEKYVIDAAVVREAIRRRGSFNLIPYDAIAKIDIFIPKDRAFDREVALRRQRNVPLEDGTIFPFFVGSVEDTILHKLEWFRMGGEVSEHQWLDVLAMLKAQFFDVDLAYLEKWAPELKIGDLVKRALKEAGLEV